MPNRLSFAGMFRPAAVCLLAVCTGLLAACTASPAAAPRRHLPVAALRQHLARRRQGRDRGRCHRRRRRFRRAGKAPVQRPGFKAELMPPPPPDPKAPPRPPRQPNVPETAVFKITVPADAPLGIIDVRFVGKWGVSNPRAFVVGDLPEVMEKEPNNDVPEAQRVDLNTTINGTMANATDVDYYVFTGKKGQRVLRVAWPPPSTAAFCRKSKSTTARAVCRGPAATTTATTPWPTAPCPRTAITTSASSSSRTRPISPAASPSTSTA